MVRREAEYSTGRAQSASRESRILRSDHCLLGAVLSRLFRSSIVPGLIALHSNRMESLRDSLLHWLHDHPLDPLEVDVIAVQSNGIAQWLRSTFAQEGRNGRGGIAAAIDTPMPSRMLWSLYRQVLGRDAVPESSPLDEAPLVWRLMRLLGTLEDTAVYRPLVRYLEDDGDLRKRYQLAQRLADLYDQYQVYRADWLADWAKGDDVLRSGGNTRALPHDQCWQAALWRCILDDVGPEAGVSGRASVHEQFLRCLRAWPEQADRPDVPRRITVFGISSLPRQTLEALVELARWTQILVCVHNPCEYHWSDIVEGRSLLRRVNSRHPRRTGMPLELSNEQLHAHAHPLLASWGRQGRDYIALLEELEEETEARQAEEGHSQHGLNVVRVFEEVGATSLLAQLQDDIRALRPLAEIQAEGRVVPRSDHSVCFHIAHSALREVEILHDQLLAVFDADPSLEPDDVIVMVPDIEKYAPHIEAVFGLYGRDDSRHLPYFIVDRGAARTNTVVDAVEQLLALPVSRVTVSQVLDLLEVAAVRQRYDLDEEGIAILRNWVEGANVRWGLDQRHREALGLPMDASLVDIHTWHFGLQRMLLGYATGEAESWNDIAPYGEVAGLDAALVGTLADIIERMVHHAEMLAARARPVEWGERLRTLLDDFLLPPNDVAGYTVEQLTLALDAWLEQCELTGFDELLPVQVVGSHWLSALGGAGMAQRFSSGAITFATLMPMRAIPFRHVCLLGMNNDDYPRPRVRMDFDLMDTDYRPGDRSRRDDDRYLFLEALLSARERLHVSWVGRSIVDNTERPPSVLVAQLRDHIALGWHAADSGRDVLEQITTEHPLQAFSPRYFQTAPDCPQLFTYSREWRQASRTRQASSGSATPRLEPVSRDEPLTVDELRRFLEHPVREFYRRRLEIRIEEGQAAIEEESFMANALEVWEVYDALIRAARPALLKGENPFPACEAAVARMQRAGDLAFGAAGVRQINSCREGLLPMFDEYRRLLDEWPQAADEFHELEYRGAIGPGISGWLRGLHRRADGSLLRMEMQGSRLVKDKKWREEKLLGHWVWHLLGNASGLRLSTAIVSPAGTARFDPVETDVARHHLDTFMAAWEEGMCRPLPVKVEFAHPVLTGLAGYELGPDTDWAALLASESLLNELRNFHADHWNSEGSEERNRLASYQEQALYEARAYPTFESLMSKGELLMWAVTLYGPMFRAVRKPEEA